jgi:hypothetical protein
MVRRRRRIGRRRLVFPRPFADYVAPGNNTYVHVCQISNANACSWMTVEHISESKKTYVFPAYPLHLFDSTLEAIRHEDLKNKMPKCLLSITLFFPLSLSFSLSLSLSLSPSLSLSLSLSHSLARSLSRSLSLSLYLSLSLSLFLFLFLSLFLSLITAVEHEPNNPMSNSLEFGSKNRKPRSN